MEKKDYRIMPSAGLWVAGQRNPGAGKTLTLTDEQARHALIAKHIEPATAEAPAEPPAKPRKQD